MSIEFRHTRVTWREFVSNPLRAVFYLLAPEASMRFYAKQDEMDWNAMIYREPYRL